MSVLDLFSLKDKVALVTGGGRGIGKAIAEAFAEAGAKVVISGRRAEWLDPTLKELRERGFDCYSVVADVSKPEDVEKTVQATIEKYGQIDVLVNNAGVTWGQPAEDYPLAKWQQVMDVNLTGIFLMSQQVGRQMIERKQGGQIINIASVAGLTGGGGAGEIHVIAYNASKAGVINFTRGLAGEWGKYGIRVNAIAPGWFPTRMSSALINANKERFESAAALGRVGDVEELKGVALFLASEASSYMTGQTLVVDGGTLI